MIECHIADLYGINKTELSLINEGFHNTVFSSPHTIFRISNSSRRNWKEIAEELAFITHLHSKGTRVSLPICSRNNKYIEECRIESQLYYIVAFRKAEGSPPNVTNQQIWNNQLFFQWGKELGNLHKNSKTGYLQRPKWTKEQPDVLKLKHRIRSDTVLKRYEQLLNQLLTYKLDPTLYGLVHNDFHQGNFFVHNGKITIYDFDDCAYHWYAYDLAVSFYHAYWQTKSFAPDFSNFSDTFWKNFLLGYQNKQTISQDLIKQIPIFLKIREIFLYVLFLEKWDLDTVEDWQKYTLTDLKNKIDEGIPYSDIDFSPEWIDKLAKSGIKLIE